MMDDTFVTIAVLGVSVVTLAIVSVGLFKTISVERKGDALHKKSDALDRRVSSIQQAVDSIVERKHDV